MVYGCRIETVENGTSISCFVLLNFRENASYVRKSLRKTKKSLIFWKKEDIIK